MNREEDKNITTNVTTKDNEGFVVHASCDKNDILLQTARASIFPVDDSAQVQTRILFDSGSQRSYISDKVRHALKLKAIRAGRVVIKTFGHELPEFTGLEFADFEHKQHRNLPVGILIGIDFHHVFMTG